MFTSLLIANRGEIAVRIMRTARRMGLRTIAVHSEADADAMHVALADEAVEIGPPPVAASYLDIDAVLDAAIRTGAEALHPGYGLLSENAGFARAVMAAGLVWVGPSAEVIEAMGDKINARNLMAAAKVPVARGTVRPPADLASALRAADEVGYPLMVKAAGGGGGIGMSAVAGPTELARVFEAARDRAARLFGSPDILLEQLIRPARHVEVQILGLVDGRVLALGERDCSLQRRFQKVVEETPSPGVSDEVRRDLLAAAVRAGEAVGYRGAGTVEFLLNPDSGEFVFLEMNTRLQVEHPVTELVTGIDLVEAQLRIAAGEDAGIEAAEPAGHAIELRIYAEDPVTFRPSPGTIETWTPPSSAHVRLDSGYRTGDTVSRFYDPLLAKLCVHAEDRAQAMGRAREALADFAIGGVASNLPFLARLLASPEFGSGCYDTTSIDRLGS